MKKIIVAILFFSITQTYSQNINGVLIADTANFKVLKVWGTHEERGYATGYLLGEQISELMQYYIKPLFGNYYSYARSLVATGNNLEFDSVYIIEAKALVQGIQDAGINTSGMDYVDALVSNSYLDIGSILGFTVKKGCSALMSWGNATDGTDLNGKSVITRHLDWELDDYLTKNQIIIMHVPSEPNEQPFVIVGFAGMMSALSAMNEHMAVFYNEMSDYSELPSQSIKYKPIWYSLRKAIESKDFNDDSYNNILDLKAVFDVQTQGVPRGCLISSLSSTTQAYDSVVAMISELTPNAPTHNYRFVSFPDSMPSNNIYVANYQICRNQLMHFCTRYNNIRNHIGSGIEISKESQWNLMKNYSGVSSNVQSIQYIPETGTLRVSGAKGSHPAHQFQPTELNFQSLLTYSKISNEKVIAKNFTIFPNPAGDYIGFDLSSPDNEISIIDITGNICYFTKNQKDSVRIDISNFYNGIYFLIVKYKDSIYNSKFTKK